MSAIYCRRDAVEKCVAAAWRGLPPGPASPLKGRGFARVRWWGGGWADVPPAHRAEVYDRRSAKAGSWRRYVSPEVERAILTMIEQ